MLQPLWEGLPSSGAAGLPRSLHGFDLEASKLSVLKALCRACKLPVGGNKGELQRRLRDILPLLPQHVPLGVALAVQPRLARKVKARGELAALAAAGGGDTMTISASRAKEASARKT